MQTSSPCHGTRSPRGDVGKRPRRPQYKPKSNPTDVGLLEPRAGTRSPPLLAAPPLPVAVRLHPGGWGWPCPPLMPVSPCSMRPRKDVVGLGVGPAGSPQGHAACAGLPTLTPGMALSRILGENPPGVTRGVRGHRPVGARASPGHGPSSATALRLWVSPAPGWV